MIRTLFLLLAIVATYVEAKETKDYSLGIEGSRPITVPVEEAEKLESQLHQFAAQIKDCETVQGDWYNISIDKSVDYSLKKNAFSCILNINLYSGEDYQCMLPHSITSRFSEAVELRIATGRIFGDFSEVEKDILFNQGYCATR